MTRAEWDALTDDQRYYEHLRLNGVAQAKQEFIDNLRNGQQTKQLTIRQTTPSIVDMPPLPESVSYSLPDVRE